VNPAQSPLSEPATTTSPSNLAEGVISAVARFHVNHKDHRQRNKNSVVSRTFGKVAVIDKAWIKAMTGHIEMPQDQELWIVDLVRETCPGTNRGLLIMQPRRKLDNSEISVLVLGMYEEELIQGLLYIRPKHKGPFWILPNALKKSLEEKYKTVNAVVVNL
jgi:hypothetical protein